MMNFFKRSYRFLHYQSISYCSFSHCCHAGPDPASRTAVVNFSKTSYQKTANEICVIRFQSVNLRYKLFQKPISAFVKYGVFAHAKRKMALGKIVEQNHKNRVYRFCHRRIPAEIFHQYFQPDIINKHATEDNDKITHKLHPALEVRALKNHKHAEVKTDRQRNKKRNKKGGDVRLEHNKTQIERLLVQYVIVGNKIGGQREQGIDAAASGVVVGLQRHKTPERRIKNIQHRKYGPFYRTMNPLHAGARR